MKNKSSYININPLSLVIVAIAISAFIGLGSYWNEMRTKTKLNKIQSHVERIYEAHKTEFVDTIKISKASYIDFLDRVNNPEKNIYKVGILVVNSKGGYDYYARYQKLETLNEETVAKLKKVLSEGKSVSSSDDLSLIDSWEEYDNNLYAFTPIKDGDNVLGFVVLSVKNNQNL